MALRVLVAAPFRTARKIAAAVGGRFQLEVVTDPDRAKALAATGVYLAVVVMVGFAELACEAPIIAVDETVSNDLLARLDALRVRFDHDQRARATALAHLASLNYEEYCLQVRARATRDYVLALLNRHDGVVAEAARSAGLLRETLHRLIRRHDVDPDWFRDRRD